MKIIADCHTFAKISLEEEQNSNSLSNFLKVEMEF
jgi:hypothetical protein